MNVTLYTVDDVAELMGISRSSVYALKKRDSWPHLLIGSKVRFSDENLADILKIYQKQPQPAERRPRIGTRARKTK